MTDDTRAEEPPTPGVIDGGARVLRELLRTPRIAKAIRIALGNIDPQAAPRLVRTLMMQDSALFFDLISASPKLVNAAVLGTRELAVQLLGLPRELRSRFAPRLLAEVSGEQLGEAVGLLLVAGAQIASPPNGALGDAIDRFDEEFHQGLDQALGRAEGGATSVGDALLGVAVASAERLAGRLDNAAKEPDSDLRRHAATLAAALRRIAEDNPALVDHVARPLVDAWRDALKER